MKIFICALTLATLALDGYSQEWKPIITYPNKSNTTTTTSCLLYTSDAADE